MIYVIFVSVVASYHSVFVHARLAEDLAQVVRTHKREQKPFGAVYYTREHARTRTAERAAGGEAVARAHRNLSVLAACITCPSRAQWRRETSCFS